jgi:hypothetical protein
MHDTSKAEIIACDCQHAYQDAKYGRGKRVHNPTRKDDKFRCTVCGSEATLLKEKKAKK